MSKVYTVSNEELLGIARLCQQEQGTKLGAAAEASLMCNRFEKQSKYKSLYEYVKNSGWWANSAYYMEHGKCRGEVLEIVASVLKGERTLPEYIDEHDCPSDIISISTGDDPWNKELYIPNKTIIYNVMGAVYTFYCIPDTGCDPFGYTERPLFISDPVEKAATWMINLAEDNSHGYSQENRWGPDYDCSSAIIQSWRQAGIPLSCTYTGNMKQDMLENGFEDVTDIVNLDNGDGLILGDVLLNELHHTAMYIGNGQEVEASINEKGGATDGKPGDQTGKEILIRSYRNYPWDCVLRYGKMTKIKLKLMFDEIQKGDECQSVWVLRTILRGRAYKTENGKLITRSKKFDDNTDYCVRLFQAKNKLEVDGIVGKQTWSKLTGL